MASIILAQNNSINFRSEQYHCSDKFIVLLENLICIDREKRWTIDQVIKYLNNDRIVKKKYFSDFEEIEDIKRQLEDYLSVSEINALLVSDTFYNTKLSKEQIDVIKYLKDLEYKQYLSE